MLNEKEKKLLKTIMADKYSIGAFSGMIYNKLIETNRPIEELTKQALIVRLKLEELTK